MLGWVGTRLYQGMPPIPDRVVSGDGAVIVPSGDIRRCMVGAGLFGFMINPPRRCRSSSMSWYIRCGGEPGVIDLGQVRCNAVSSLPVRKPAERQVLRGVRQPAGAALLGVWQ